MVAITQCQSITVSNPHGRGIEVLPVARHDAIVDLVNGAQTVSTDELVNHLGVSAETVRRDLALLEERGAIRRVHGGAATVLRRRSGEEASFSERAVTRSQGQDRSRPRRGGADQTRPDRRHRPRDHRGRGRPRHPRLVPRHCRHPVAAGRDRARRPTRNRRPGVRRTGARRGSRVRERPRRSTVLGHLRRHRVHRLRRGRRRCRPDRLPPRRGDRATTIIANSARQLRSGRLVQARPHRAAPRVRSGFDHRRDHRT